MAWMVTAILTSLAGMGLVYTTWRMSGLRRGAMLTALGFACLLLVALPLWTAAEGAEIGVSLWLLGVGPLAWIFVVLNADRRPEREQSMPSAAITVPGLAVSGRQLLRSVGVLPLAGAAAAGVALVLASVLPWQWANRLSLAILAVPLLWGGAAYWVCADREPLRPLLVLALLVAASAAWLWVSAR